VTRSTDSIIQLSTRTTRRRFCATACHAASLVAVGAMAGCGGGPSAPSGVSTTPAPTVPATLNARVVTIPLDTATAISTVGAGAIAQTSLGSFLVAQTAPGVYTALGSTCTHEACTVTGFSDGRYVCPCHGSQYATSGSVVTGPATRALPQFPTQVNGSVLTFTV